MAEMKADWKGSQMAELRAVSMVSTMVAMTVG
jgi:hypothetical protein